jgi:hypothetical protein
MPYPIAGIDVHKKMLAIAVASRSRVTSTSNGSRSGPTPSNCARLLSGSSSARSRKW